MSLALGALGLVALAEDAVVVDIAVDAAVAGKALLVVVRRRRERRYRRRHADVAALGDEAMALTDELVVVSDVPEVKEVLLGKKEMRVVRENEALLECVHVSDRFEAAADEEPALDKELVRVRMKAPRSEVEFAALVELVEMACGLVDRLAALRLQGEARRVSEKKRAAMLEMENRAKREEKRREEQEAVREKEVTPEEMKRREERRRRKKGVAKVAILR